jgi:hypothetical protein
MVRSGAARDVSLGPMQGWGISQRETPAGPPRDRGADGRLAGARQAIPDPGRGRSSQGRRLNELPGQPAARPAPRPSVHHGPDGVITAVASERRPDTPVARCGRSAEPRRGLLATRGGVRPIRRLDVGWTSSHEHAYRIYASDKVRAERAPAATEPSPPAVCGGRSGDLTGPDAAESPLAGAVAVGRGFDRPWSGGIPTGRCRGRGPGITPAHTRWNPHQPVRRSSSGNRPAHTRWNPHQPVRRSSSGESTGPHAGEPR